MSEKIVRIITWGIVVILGVICASTPVMASNDAFCKNLPPNSEAWVAMGCGGQQGKEIKGVIVKILNAIIGISGIIAAVFLIVGGVSFMTSAGDAGKITKAKQTIMYALIGLAICALAFAIVNFAIGVVNKR